VRPSRRGRRRRTGAALLEAIVALAILSIAGVSLLRVAVEASHAIELSAAAEIRLREAGRLMDAASLWSRTELDQRLGERAQGAMRMRISRPTAQLYRVELMEGEGDALVLTTTLYRASRSDAAR
jgi:type II secretory pathway pseudopilin PulG